MSLVERLQGLAKERGTTFKQLERDAGLGNGVIRRWDKQSPRLDILVKVADCLQASLDYLVYGSDETAPPSWEDAEVMAEVGTQLPGMLEHIGELLAGASPEMQKLAFDLLVELKHLLSLSDPAIQTAGARMMSVYLLQWDTYLVALERQSPETQAAALQRAMDELCPRPDAPKKEPPTQP